MAGNGWSEHEKLVLSELERLSRTQEIIADEMIDIKILLESTKVWNKVFSATFGGTMGIIAVIASELIRSFMIN